MDKHTLRDVGLHLGLRKVLEVDPVFLLRTHGGGPTGLGFCPAALQALEMPDVNNGVHLTGQEEVHEGQ